MKAYSALMVLLFPCAAAAQLLVPPLPENDANIGYKTPEEALSALRQKPGTKIRDQRGWIIVEDHEAEKTLALWSFAPEGHPAHPSVVKRVVYEENGKVMIRMGVICGAAKEPCDALVRDFQALNEQIKSRMQHGP